jgi:hypothetical protein
VGHPAHAEFEERGTRRSDGYARRQPQQTVLYQTVAERWPLFRERLEESGGLPKFVVREFEAYLTCGVLEKGCLHLVCRSCGYSQVVAFSCKKPGLLSELFGPAYGRYGRAPRGARAAGRTRPALDLLVALGPTRARRL